VIARILLPGKLTSGATGVRGDSYSNGLKYATSVARAGGVIGTVAPLQEYLAHVTNLVTSSDGVLIQGGGDIDPSRYGETQRTDTVYGIVPAHDNFEIAVVREAVRLNKPVLAICRGIQILNVALGGTLHQDLGDVLPNRESHWDTYHPIALEPGSRIAVAMKTHSPEHSHSFHHQALKEVAADLVVTARAPDGVIEAVEHSRCKWVVGVQWHPEDNAAESTDQQRLFDSFIRACRS
jgi:putative glutamine amidotransferase